MKVQYMLCLDGLNTGHLDCYLSRLLTVLARCGEKNADVFRRGWDRRGKSGRYGWKVIQMLF